MKKVTSLFFALFMLFCIHSEMALANAVDWHSGFIEAEGYGAPPASVANPAQSKALARRAAVVDAQRNLVELVAGVNLTAQTTVQNMMVANDTVKTAVSGFVKGAVVADEKQMSDGLYKVTLRVPLYGVKGLKSVMPQITPDLEKVNLDISKQILDKQGDTAQLVSDDITITLNWYQGRKGTVRDSEKVDLDLGFFWQAGDNTKNIIDQLNVKKFGVGAFGQSPYAEMTADDRSGNNADGETIRINGKKAAGMKRYLIYSYIYTGVPNWTQIDGVVTIKQPNKPDIVIKLDADGRDERTCAIATIESDGAGNLKVTREVQYFSNRSPMDKAYNWGFSWQKGSKD